MIQIGIGLDSSEGHTFVDQKDRYKHLLCLGSSGMGKTTFLAYLIKKELDNACIVLDPNGNLIEQIASFISSERLVYVDKKNPISLNPLSREYLNWSENAKELIQLINAAVKEVNPKQVQLTALMTQIVKNALRVFSGDELTIKHLMDFLDDDKIRNNYSHDSFWKNFDKVNREAKESCKRVTARLSLYYDDLDLRPFLTGQNKFDIQDIIDNKKIVLINCEGFDDESTAFLGCLVTNQIKSFYLHKAKIDGNPLFFYCDEYHLFIQEHFGRFLAEGRKFNFSFNFAGHTFALLDTLFRAMILRCHVKVILQNDGDDARILSSSLGVKTNDIIDLKPFHAIARIGNRNHKIQLFQPPKELPLFTRPQFVPSKENEYDFLGDEWIIAQ